MAKKLAHLYTESKSRWEGEHFRTIYGNDGTLFSGGTYPTRITPADLPEWYVHGRYYKNWGYLCAKGIKYLVYEPNMVFNHMFKDDFLYISYDRPIEPEPDREKHIYKYRGFDEYIYGGVIVAFLRAAEKYSGYDISGIKEQIEKKRLWFKETYPEFYKLEVSADRPFFLDEEET